MNDTYVAVAAATSAAAEAAAAAAVWAVSDIGCSINDDDGRHYARVVWRMPR